jgi:hypothetical protein
MMIAAGPNNPVEAVGFAVIVIVFFFLGVGVIAAFIKFLGRNKAKPLPKLAGTSVPQLGEGIDVSKRYDIVYSSGDYGSQFVERLEGIKIIGYVGSEDDQTVGKMYLRSRWLVVEFTDGRKAYLMPHAIMSLQETRAN